MAAAILEFFFGTNSLGQKANLISSLQMASHAPLLGSRLFGDALGCSASLWILVFILKMGAHENRQPQVMRKPWWWPVRPARWPGPPSSVWMSLWILSWVTVATSFLQDLFFHRRCLVLITSSVWYLRIEYTGTCSCSYPFPAPPSVMPAISILTPHPTPNCVLFLKNPSGLICAAQTHTDVGPSLTCDLSTRSLTTKENWVSFPQKPSSVSSASASCRHPSLHRSRGWPNWRGEGMKKWPTQEDTRTQKGWDGDVCALWWRSRSTQRLSVLVHIREARVIMHGWAGRWGLWCTDEQEDRFG